MDIDGLPSLGCRHLCAGELASGMFTSIFRYFWGNFLGKKLPVKTLRSVVILSIHTE